MSSIVPAGVKSAAEQDVAKIEVGRRVGCWRRKSIRTQLLLAYVLLSVLAFGALVVISKHITDTAEDEVIANSREELMNQIINTSKAALRESSLVLDARLDDGFSVLVAATTFALFDVLGGESPRIGPLPSYTEPDVAYLAQPTELIPRYHCRDTEPLVGCSNDGLQKVSLVASSVYIVGSTLGGDGWDAPSMDMRGVDQTSILDAYIKAAYAVRESWVDSFVAGFGGGSPSPPLFRQYPGAVGNLSTDGSSAERRTYDPTTRGWYTSTTSAYGDTLPSRTLDEKLPPLPQVISPPYLDRFGRGYLISVTTPVIGPTNPRGAAAGVSGADILVSELQDIVTTIKSRETGEAFFLYRATGQVVASGQLEVSFTMTAIPTIDTLVLPGSVGSTFGQLSGWSGASSTFVSDASGSGSRRMTDPTGVAYELVWQDAWASAYVLLTCTREDEILVPIESQLASISRASAAVFAKSLAICAACLVVIVAASVVLSFLMARPVVQTLAQSDKIVANIGGDLFKGVNITGRRRDEKPSWKDGSSPLAGLVQLPGEVAALRGEFVKALFELGKKRVRTVAPASPLYQSGLPPSAPTVPTSNLPGPYAQCVGQIHQPEGAKRQSQALDLEMEAPVSQPLTLWNSIVAKITIYLLLPTVVAMVVVVAITFGTVFHDVESWMSPVRDTMVAEELLSLDVRAYERSQLASAFIGTAAGSLQVLHGFATELVDGELPHGEARTTYITPWWPGPGPCPSLTGPPSRLFECSTAPPKYGAPVSYKPRGVLPPSVKMVDPAAVSVAPGDDSTAVDLDSVADPWVREQLLLSQLDLPFSYALFASNIMDAYYGGHVSEAYKQFPYSRLESYYDPSYATGAKKCDAFPSTPIDSYTPVCRPWYQNAIRQQGVVYNRVLNDATNPGQMFLGLSTALRMSNGSSLVGVLGVSVGLEELANDVGAFPTGDMQRLEATKGSDLYLRGYAFMWDEEGFAIVHKNYKKPANQGQGALLVADLDAGSDAVFRSAFQTNVVEQGRVRGVWEFPWFNPDKGRNEIWHYSYMPVNNTPYMIALTVVADEVTAGPDAAQDRIEDSLRNGMWLSLAIIAVLLLLLVGFTVWLYLRFALPLRRLLQIVKKWGRRDYKGDISDSDAHNAANRELTALMLNFQKMLVALRFGETSWADGSWVSVLRNNLAALDLVEAGGNHRSLGAVMNNVALSAADASVQEAYPSLQVGEIYGAAISAVKEQMAAEPGNPALVDTLAFRLLNCTLWHLKAKPPRPAEAKAGLDEMLQYCTSPRTMATVAQRVSAEVLASGRIPAVQPVAHWHRVPVQPPEPAHADLEIVGAVALLIEKALAFCASSPLAHDDSDLLADLALAHCDIGCMSGSCEPPQLALWALVSLPIIGESTRTRLSLHAKAGCGPDFARFIDAACGLEEDGNFSGPVSKGAATARWRVASEQAGLPKVMLVALDLSHSMHGARLSTCQTSLKTILTKNMEDRDRVALVSFADDVRTEFGLTVAGPAGGTARQSMRSTVDLLGTRGGTAFYDACVVGALTLHQQLAGEPATPKWLVALTDGEDNRSRPDSARRCIGLLKSTPNLNLALITVGAINMSVCQQFLDATTEAGNKALLVQAKNQTEISKAFASVAAAMDAGVAEVL